MTVNVYRSTDASAPVLSGSAGAMVALLDACLVNGYGSKAAAGWAQEFSGTNKAVYRAAIGNRFRLRVDDAGTSSCRVVGYETMSDVDTGTELFPTAAQVAGGLYWTKSATADATARPWLVIATDTFVYVMINSNSSATTPISSLYCFGDFTSYKTGDVYNALIIGSTAAAHAAGTSRGFGCTHTSQMPTSYYVGHYLARPYTGIAGAVQFGKLVTGPGQFNNPTTPSAMGGNTSYGGESVYWAAMSYPDNVNNGVFLSPVIIFEANNTFRGVMPGLWNICAAGSIGTHGDTFSGNNYEGALQGLTFDLWKWVTGTPTGQVALETSDTW